MDPLRERFESLDRAALDAFVNERRQEDLHLDFKTIRGEFKGDDRKNLAAAISGFANSAGGLIVWGVDCRKGNDGADCAIGLAPIPNAAAVYSQIQTATSDVVSPFVDGVEHRLIQEADGKGYIVTYVPESASGPHMANTEHRYYKRNGSSFRQMEHFDVADMFGRRQRPELHVSIKGSKKYPGSTGKLHLYKVEATIDNRGRAMARFYKVRIAFPKAVLGWPEQASPDSSAHDHAKQSFEYRSTPEAPLYPGESRTLGCNGLEYHMDDSLLDFFGDSEWPEIAIEVFAEGNEARRWAEPFKDKFENF